MNLSTIKIKKFVDYKKNIYHQLSNSARKKFDIIVFSSANKSIAEKSVRMKLYENYCLLKSIRLKNRSSKTTNILNPNKSIDFLIAEKYPNNFLTNQPFYESLEKKGFKVVYFVSKSLEKLVEGKSKITFSSNDFTVKDLFHLVVDLFFIFIATAKNNKTKSLISYYLLIFNDLIETYKFKKNIANLKSLRSKYSIISEDHSIEIRTLIKYGNHLGQIIFLQHGLIDTIKVKESGLIDEHLFNKAILWGDYYFDAYKKSKHNVCSIGSIKHSALLEKYDFKSYEQDKSILIVSTPPTGKALNIEQVEKLTLCYIEYANKLIDYKFYYKLHQAEQISFYNKYSPPNNFKFIEPENNIYELITRCKHVVVTASTIGHEAYLFNKNLILINVDYNHLYPFAKLIIEQNDFSAFEKALKTDGVKVNENKAFYIKTSPTINNEILSAILN
jgi:hypothetical protein